MSHWDSSEPIDFGVSDGASEPWTIAAEPGDDEASDDWGSSDGVAGSDIEKRPYATKTSWW